MSATYRPPQDAEDPGREYGLVALITAFFCPIAGMALGFLARSKSRSAGYGNTRAAVAIWIGLVLFFVYLIVSVPLFTSVVVAWHL